MPEGWWPRGATPHPKSVRQPRGATAPPWSGAVAESARLQPRRSSQEDLSHCQGALAAGAQESIEELFHIHGQKGRQ